MSQTSASYYGNQAAGQRMRPSRVLARIRDDHIATCFKIISADPRIYEIVAMTGCDCIWLCTEHTPVNYAEAGND